MAALWKTYSGRYRPLLPHGDPIETPQGHPPGSAPPRAAMSWARAQVRAQGRELERRLRRAPGRQLLAGLREAGALGPTETAALGPPGGRGWARRLRALALARGEETCRVLLRLLARLEEPGPLDFYNPRRDAEPSHRSDCPCCHPSPEREGGELREEEEDGEAEEEEGGEEDGGEEEEEEGGEGEDGDPEEEEGGEDGGPEEEEGDGEEVDGDHEDGGPEEEGDGEEDGDGEEEEGGDGE
ncbi:uncharacterized protein ACIBXB_005247 isoform 4-T5 [Morphnus guianensis]